MRRSPPEHGDAQREADALREQHTRRSLWLEALQASRPRTFKLRDLSESSEGRLQMHLRCEVKARENARYAK